MSARQDVIYRLSPMAFTAREHDQHDERVAPLHDLPPV
jgi:hypothetical protein